ncbi:MAG TPA: HD domain-containing protein [Acidimicrobiia bacterium]|nr:HD domain-containing protein [Acidimicrobiia bacterium]
MRAPLIRVMREERERREHRDLSPLASKATDSRGRMVDEPHDEYRTVFERDRDRVIHSKAFRRLKHKTQVFLNPEGDHYVTRLTHTVHVTQVGRAMAVALGLNEPLTEAICLAHDVGHSPFGHTGEDALTPYVDGEWLHSAQGVRVLSVLEPLNLTWEVLDGVRAHSWKIDPPPTTPEGDLCRFADRIAYLTHDVADAIRARVISFVQLPERAVDRFGDTSRQWIGSMVNAVVETSAEAGRVTMDERTLDVMNELRDFMFANVYLSAEAEEQKQRAITVIRNLTDHYAAHPDEIPASYKVDDTDDLTRAIDYVAGMTDRFALSTHDTLFRPRLF